MKRLLFLSCLFVLLIIQVFAIDQRLIVSTLSDTIYEPLFPFQFKIPMVYRTTIERKEAKDSVIYNIKQTSTNIILEAKKTEDFVSLEYLEDLYWIPFRDSIPDINMISIEDVQKDLIPGKRYEFEYHKDKRSMRVYLYYFIKDNIFYSIRFESPNRLVKNNYKLFSVFLKNIKIE
ncbi:MAG: hypothetical protein C0601_00725 [Candidatus Muiribacterium halophilum]|uniref:PsbP C-terminal domain-containing protein n=1 Tax=Muiribacterium halophilum TaxID=2053465 RepID=A0A2N5ZMK2_MUIH1|nr:MAG: hypothetical protein C0601_00725 [Candidatus Muirbacterium halophilum]